MGFGEEEVADGPRRRDGMHTHQKGVWMHLIAIPNPSKELWEAIRPSATMMSYYLPPPGYKIFGSLFNIKPYPLLLTKGCHPGDLLPVVPQCGDTLTALVIVPLPIYN